MAKELLVSPSGCVVIQRTVDELINHIQQEENKFFYQECLKIQIDPEALLKCEKEILNLQERIKRFEKERDAAIADLTAAVYGSCRFCKYNNHGFCKGKPSLDFLTECWEWRGVQDD